MRIKRMVATFGKLENAQLTLEPGLNVIQAPNEWGKSTWCAFVAAMLYGLDTRAKSTKTTLADKERYAPWSGNPMSGRIDLEWQGRGITLERTTRGRVPMGQFRAYETDSGLELPELTAANCGQLLLGVEQSVFRRAGFIRQSEMPVTQDEALRRRLNALVTTGDESGDAQRLEKALRELKNRCRYNRTGLLPQAEAERRELEERLTQLQELHSHSQRIRARLGEEKSRLRALENHRRWLEYAQAEADAGQVAMASDALERAVVRLAQLENSCAGLPGRETAEEKLAALRQLQNDWDDVNREQRLHGPLPAPPEQAEPFRGMSGADALQMVQRDEGQYRAACGSVAVWLAVLAGLAALGAGTAVLLLYRVYWALGVMAAGLCAVLTGVILAGRRKKIRDQYRRKYGTGDPEQWRRAARDHAEGLARYRQLLEHSRRSRRDLEDRLAELEHRREGLCAEETPQSAIRTWQQVIARWEDYHAALREERHARSHLEAMQALLRPVQPPEGEDSLTYPLDQTLHLMEDARQEQQRLQLRLGQYQGRMEALGSREELEKQLAACDRRLRRLEEVWDALTLAQETLTQARLELQRRFAPRIARRAQEWMGRMTGGRYTRLTLSEDLSLLAAAGEENLQQVLWRSDGTVDQLYLALRLAVAEELTPEAPLVLDDVFVRFDDSRMAAAMEILKELGEQKQVLLFTCQSRELQHR